MNFSLPAAFALKTLLLGALVSAVTLVPPSPAQAVTVLGSGVHDNRAAGVQLSGSWTSISSEHATNKTYANLAAPGYAQATFSGTGIAWISRTNAAGGIADVFVDGSKKKSVDLYSAQTTYQRTVFRLTGLRAGQHTIKIVRTGTKSTASKGRNLMLDAIQVLDSRPPAVPATVTARAERTGARVSWAPSRDSDLAGYRLYRQQKGSSTSTLVGTTKVGTTNLLDIALASSTTYTYRVAAVDSSGNMATSGPATVTTPARTPSTVHRYRSCPTATVTVTNRTELVAALSDATAGSVIVLKPGHYAGEFSVTARGTAAAPVWICGPRTAIVEGAGTSRRGGIRVSSSAHVVIAGMTVRNSQKGIMVWRSSHITVADTRVEQIGDEAIHLLAFTSDSTVAHNSIAYTGRVNPAYGEGVYIGSDDGNWCAFSDCLPDRSDRNTVVGNAISHTPAEPIEAKVATTGGVISGNTINGVGMRPTSYALIYVKGNHYTVADNAGSNSSIDGILVIQREQGWGRDNILLGNHFSGSIPGYGVRVDPSGLGNVVACGVTTGTNSIAATNTPCQP